MATQYQIADGTASSDTDFGARESYARRMHRRQQLRRGLIGTFVIAVVGLGTIYFGSWVRHYQAAWGLAAAGFKVVWQPDPNRGLLSGHSSVNCVQQFLFTPTHHEDLNMLSLLDNVEELRLAECDVPEASLATIKDLPALRELNLARTNHFRYSSTPGGLSDAVMVHLQGLTRLRGLSLAGNQITDNGLKRIAGLTNLQHLDLSATEITDAGLSQLAGLTQLSSISLGGTRVTPAGLARLQELFPNAVLSLELDPELAQSIQRWRKRQP